MERETDNTALRLLPGRRLKTAFALAIAADVLQIAAFPIFFEGGFSPADDLVDVAMCAMLSWLLGWRWEFAPSFLAKLLPGVDLIPLCTLAVFSVYRKERQAATAKLQS